MAADVIAQALSWAVPALLGAVSAWAVKSVKGLRKREDALSDGVKTLLRCELVRSHDRHVVRGEPMSATDFSNVCRVYEAYKGLGGNGTGTKLFDDIRKVTINE